MTLGQEFRAYAVMISSAVRAVERGDDALMDINMGATAIGAGINSPPGHADLVTKKLAEVSGFELRRARNLFEATQNAGAFGPVHKLHEHIASHLRAIFDRGSTAKSST